MLNGEKSSSIQNEIDLFCYSVNSQYQMEFAKKYSLIGDHELYGGKHAGSKAEHEGSRLIADELIRLGLKNVEQIPVSTCKFQFTDASITFPTRKDGKVIKPYSYTAPGTNAEGLSAEIVDVGLSQKDSYINLDVKGKIALIEAMGVLEGSFLSAQIMQAELNGAIGVITYSTEDVLNEETIRTMPLNYLAKIPAVAICLNDSKYVKQVIAEDSETTANLMVDVELLPDGGTSFEVVGEIPGRSDERIIFSSHLDHFFRCMQDNISSVATLLGIARAMIESGYEPKRTITFVFNGGHETGMLDARYPYIVGSYKLLNEKKQDWCGKTVLDINFEYSALELNQLSAFGSHEINSLYREYLNYAPEQADGFNAVSKEVGTDEYLFLSWADTISYISNGIPTFMNDSLHEQIYEMTSPYIGRDHSNHDNLEIFSEDALRSNSRHFGGFGIFVDNLPIAQLDFAERARTLAFSDDELAVARKHSVETSDYMVALQEHIAIATGVYETVKLSNNKRIFTIEESKTINHEMLLIYKGVVDTFDKISPQDFITPAHKKHIGDMLLLDDAIDAIKNNEVDRALAEIMPGIDIAACSKYFQKEIVEHAKARINSEDWAHKRLWARGRELSCLTLYDTVQSLQKKVGQPDAEYSLELKDLKEALQEESMLLIQSLESETSSLRKLTERLIRLKGIIERD